MQNLRDMIDGLEKYGNSLRDNFNAGPQEQKWFILSYSMKIKEAIDSMQDDKEKTKLLDLYNEFTVLISYFLHIIDNSLSDTNI